MKFVNFLKNTLILTYSIVAECLQTNFSHFSSAHISESKRLFNMKSSTYYFLIKTKVLVDFQIFISVPLKNSTNIVPSHYSTKTFLIDAAAMFLHAKILFSTSKAKTLFASFRPVNK